MRRTRLPVRHGERGQTIIFVALALVSLLAMAALAIDVVTLYVAKSEAQRAADAAALAGANAFVSAGATTYPTNPGLNLLAGNMATAFINAALAQNNVSGSPPQLVATTIDPTTYPGNPHVTVTVQQTNLPTFFARIWGTNTASVQATATAEAYNPSNVQNPTGSYVPVRTRCVKPILVLNKDPNGNIFVSTSSGNVYQPSLATGYIGDFVSFSSACGPNPGSCTFSAPNSGTVYYVPAAIPAGSFPSGTSGTYNSTVCPGDCTLTPATPYQQSIACCDTTLYNFNQCGVTGTAPTLYYDTSNNPDTPTFQTRNGLQCVIHTSAGLGDLPDKLNVSPTYPTDPFQITPGTYTRTALGVGASTYLSASDSIVTLPIIILSGPGRAVTVVGFLQVFIANVPSTLTVGADFDAYILNVVGCGAAASPGTVSGGGVSAVPVRLITPP